MLEACHALMCGFVSAWVFFGGVIANCLICKVLPEGMKTYTGCRSCLLFAAWVMALLLAVCTPVWADSRYQEQQVKAAYLLRFLNYVEWPASSMGAAGAPLIVGVLADQGFVGLLSDGARSFELQGRKVVIRPVRTVSDLAGAHMLYVGEASPLLPALLSTLAGQPVLLVSDDDVASGEAAAIRLVVDSARVRFDISPSVAERNGLKVSARLLALARNTGGRR